MNSKLLTKRENLRVAVKDDLLSKIKWDFFQEYEQGPNVHTKLADIVNKWWSSKLTDSKLKEKMEKTSRPANCQRLQAPKANPEIWSKFPHQEEQQDLRMANFQKTLAKVGSSLIVSTEMLVKHLGSAKEPPHLSKLATSVPSLCLATPYMRCLNSGGTPIRRTWRKIMPVCAPRTFQLPLFCLMMIRASNRISQAATGERNSYHRGGKS